jgi:copper chaperone CopZ
MEAGAFTFPRWGTPRPDEIKKEDDMELEVKGMTCGNCEAAVSRALQSVDPAATVTVHGDASTSETAMMASALDRLDCAGASRVLALHASEGV